MKYIISKVTSEGLEKYVNSHVEHDPDAVLEEIKYLTDDQFLVIITKETKVKPKRKKQK